MRRIRHGLKICVRRLGPPVALLIAVTILGFGAHAALDWHRHGSPGTSFFHLHVHFGEHHHHGHGHDHHHAGDDRDHQVPGPHRSEHRSQSGTLTLALGLAPAPAVASVADAVRPTCEWASDRSPILAAHAPADPPWSPRGPPV